MTIRFSGQSGGSTRAFDVDVLSWEAAVIAAGGAVSLARRILVDQTVYALKTAGDWDSIDDLMIYAAENQAQALVSLKLRLVGLPVNSPAFTADRCVLTDGVTQYVDTGFIPSTMATRMTGTDQMIGMYEVVELTGNNYGAGIFSSANASLRIRPRLSTALAAAANYAATTFTLAVSDSRGLSCAYRTPAPEFGAAKNGASIGTTAPAGNTTSLLSTSAFVGGVNNAGVLANPRATSCGYLVFGKAAVALSGSFYSTMQAHMGAIGGAV